MLTVRDLVVEVGAKRIVDGVTLQVRPGEKVGLVGRNGAGKTTLLRVLGGADRPRAGTVRRADLTGYLSQDPRSDAVPDDTTVLAHVLSGRGLDDLLSRTEKLRIALEENPSTENIERFSAAQEAFEAAGGYAAEAEVRKFADGVGLRADRLDLHLGALSGGERRRAELVRILFGGSDLLLLDEPTNHLDADARSWLLKFLRSYRGALLVVSHDLDLLDEAITRVVHIDRESEEGTGTLVEYKGTYSQYLVAREEHEERAAKLAERQTREIARLKVQAGGDARPDRQARACCQEPRPTPGQARGGEGAEHVEAQGARGALPRAAVGRSHRAHRHRAVQVVRRARRVRRRVVRRRSRRAAARDGAQRRGQDHAPQGAGRRAEPRPRRGELGTHVSVGYYAQEHEGIVPGRTLLEHMREASPAGDGALRNLLGMFGLSGEKVFQDADTLSGGEKTKLALAQLVAGRHNVLLLDEPTNNLDPSSRHRHR